MHDLVIRGGTILDGTSAVLFGRSLPERLFFFDLPLWTFLASDLLLTLIAAALASVGVAGDALARAVRNNPYWIASGVGLGIAAAGALVILGSNGRQRRLLVVPLTLVKGAVIELVLVGASSLSDKDAGRDLKRGGYEGRHPDNQG